MYTEHKDTVSHIRKYDHANDRPKLALAIDIGPMIDRGLDDTIEYDWIESIDTYLGCRHH